MWDTFTHIKKNRFPWKWKCLHSVLVSLSFRSAIDECRGDRILHEAPSGSPHGVPAAVRSESHSTLLLD